MVFPTLVSDVVTVALNIPVSEATVLISDAQGKKLASRHYSGQPSTQFDLDLAAFPPGVLLLSVLTELQTQFLQFSHLQPLYAAIAGGLITGTGFLVLFRHRCSLGGVGILALYLQDRYGWRAGKVQMAVDCCIVLLALWSVEPLRVAWSIAGAVALNLVLAMNHRPGRYMAV